MKVALEEASRSSASAKFHDESPSKLHLFSPFYLSLISSDAVLQAIGPAKAR